MEILTRRIDKRQRSIFLSEEKVTRLFKKIDYAQKKKKIDSVLKSWRIVLFVQ